MVIWTRLAPEPLVPGGGMRSDSYGVRYELATDEEFFHVIRRGGVAAVADEAHSVRAELDDLEPAHEYFYRFKFGPEVSPIGRTRTAPARDAAVASLRFAFVSCQNFADGYFTPYADVATSESIDAVIHLGDYIYEGTNAIFRQHEPRTEIRSLDEYRVRHGQYKTDLDLQAAHAAHPWLVTWDDHEVDNNYAGLDQDPDAVPPERFVARRAAAYRAYWEHMPLRRIRKPEGAFFNLYRRFHWGTLATFNVLDGRQYRSDQAPCTDAQRLPSGYCPGYLLPERTMLGTEQRDWLFEDLAATTAQWNVLAQQTALAPYDRDLDPAVRDHGQGDNWDGYVAERQLLLEWLVDRQTRNPIVMTGDTHANWVRNVPPDSDHLDAPPVATEFLGTSISSGGDSIPPFTEYGGDADNPHLLFHNNNRGYMRCTVTADAWTSEFRTVPTVVSRPAPASTLATFAVPNGLAGAQRVGAPPV